MRNAKKGLNINRFLLKYQNTFILVHFVAVYFIWELSSYQIFEVLDQYLQNSQLYAHFRSQCIFVINMIVAFDAKNNIVFVCLDFHFLF